MRLDADGWLCPEPGGAKVIHLPTVRTSPLAAGGAVGLVWHATGGVGGPRFAEGLARRIQTYRRGVDRPASWHVLISAQAGTLYQSAPFTIGTWHVGLPGVIAGIHVRNINAVAIGIELENAGPLAQIQGAFYAWPYWLDHARRKPDPRYRVAASRVVRVNGRAYDAFTSAQIASARELVIALIRYKRWAREAFTHCHSDFAAPRKTDPGDLWNASLPALLDAAFEAVQPPSRQEDEVTVVTGPPSFDPEDGRASDAPSVGGPEMRRAS
jgi:hypothetical protein